MTSEAERPAFRYSRRVAFHETDLAGIVHFSWYFRYMEEAEHALWRAAGLSIDRADSDIGWPRISTSCDFLAPLRFEDEFEVLVRIESASRRTIRYAFELVRGAERVGLGTIVAACARRGSGRLEAIELPAGLLDRLRAAAADGDRPAGE